MRQLIAIQLIVLFGTRVDTTVGEQTKTSTMNWLKTILSAAAIGGLSLGASAQGDRPMGLRECMEYAVNSSVSVREQLSKVDDARLDRRSAILEAFTPSVDGSAYEYYRWGRSIDPETNTYVTTTSLNKGMGVNAGITLFNGFSAINNIKIANTSLMMGNSARQQECDKVCLATMEAYFNVVYYNSLVEIIAKQRDNAERALLLARRQEELGAKGYADVVQMEAELSDREYELVTARNSLQSAKITLEDVMFFPVDSVLTIDMSLAALEECGEEDGDETGSRVGNGMSSLDVNQAVGAATSPIAAVAAIAATSPAGETAGSPMIGLNANWADSQAASGTIKLAASGTCGAALNATGSEADAIVSRAKLYMPAVIQARGTLDNAARNLSTAKWQFLPKLQLYGGWSTSYYTYPGLSGYVTAPFWTQFKNNSGEYLELALSIPIYDRLLKHTRLAKMRNEYRRADDSYKKALRDVESEVRRALQDRDGALAAMRQASSRAEAQKEAWKINVKKYEQGLISGIEYNTAASSYLKAEAESLNAKLQYQLKRRIVDYYSGISYLDQK